MERYPPPSSLEELRSLLGSASSEDRLRAAMASFQLNWEGVKAELVAQLRSEGSSLVKATLVKAVGRFQDSECLSLLSGFLSDPDARVRANTVEALGFYQTPQIVPLLNPMTQDESSRVRGNALLVIGRFHQEKILTHVNQMALSADAGQRETAIFVLSRIGGSYAAQRLLALHPREPHPPLQLGIFQCLKALEKQGIPEAVAGVPLLEARIAPGEDAAGSPEVGDSSEVLSDPSLPAPSKWPEDPPRRNKDENPASYPEDLASPAPRRRLEAVQLAPDSDPEVFPRLAQVLSRETDDFVIATLVKKLGRVGGEKALPLLMPFIQSTDGRVRANTLEGIEATGASQVLDVARSLLEDEHPRVRAQAARILASLTQEQGKAVSVLKEMLLTGDEQGSLSAVHALVHINATVILEILELALVQPQQKVRSRVLQALRIMGESNSLAARLADRYSTASSFEDEEHVARLLVRMNSRDEDVRYEALRHLSLIRSEKAQSRIELATSDAAEKVRNLARALVEDFGKAYKRQGVLHSLGICAAEALRAGQLDLPGGQQDLDSLDEVAQALGSGEEGAKEAPRLLARRRELLVGLGERVYRECPGTKDPSLQKLLSHLRVLEDVPLSAPPTIGSGAAERDLEKNDAVLRETLREVEQSSGPQVPGSATSSRRRKEPMPPPPPSMAEQVMSLGKDKHGSQAMGILVVMAAVAGLAVWITSTIHAGMASISKSWSLPVDARCYVGNDGEYGFAATDQGELLSFALPSGSPKWRHPVASLIPEMLLVGTERLIVFSSLDKVLGIHPRTGKETWSYQTRGGILPGAVLSQGKILLAIRRADGHHEVTSLASGSGKELWSSEITTGPPGGLAIREELALLVSGSTLYALDLGSGKEVFSFDHGEDFLRRGEVAWNTGAGIAYLTSPSRVLGVSSSGIKSQESAEFKEGKPLCHPLQLSPDRFLMLIGEEAVVLDEQLQELSRLRLPFLPRVQMVFPGGVLVSDRSPRVLRLDLVGTEVEIKGMVQATGTVSSLSAVDGHALLGTRGGVELKITGDFVQH